ncbi:hypothetical protein C5S42_09810 [Candidatus Methanomarinus sp.]|nr:hypothetical protein C5S42_09810 [ANME-2 cluster archaeon]
MTATEVTESTERGLGGGKDISVISVYSVAESYKKQIWFSITQIYTDYEQNPPFGRIFLTEALRRAED